MALQPFIRRGARSNATARRLIASQHIAPHVLASTVYKPLVIDVRPCRALRDVTLAGIALRAGERFFLVASKKFAGRCYVVVRRGSAWQTSCKDERSAEAIVARVRAQRIFEQVA